MEHSYSEITDQLKSTHREEMKNSENIRKKCQAQITGTGFEAWQVAT